MNERRGRWASVPQLAAAIAVVGAIGGTAFWAWRKRAPLSRSYRRAQQRSDEKRDDRGPNPERNPGTDSV